MGEKAQKPMEDNSEDETMGVEQENIAYSGEETFSDGGSINYELASNKTLCLIKSCIIVRLFLI